MRRLFSSCWLLLLLAIVASVFVAVPTLFAGCGGATPQACPSAPGGCISERDLCLLEPFPGMTAGAISVDSTGTFFGTFFEYVNNGVWQFAFGVGIGLAVFNGAVGGLQIVLSNGDSGKVEAGKSKFLWSIVGLIILLLSGVILEFINPFGFRNI